MKADFDQGETIREKVTKKQRLSREDALFLIQEENWTLLKDLANKRRKEVVGDDVVYASTLFIHPTNLCELSCPLCSYYAKPGWAKAWFLTPQQIEEKIRNHLHFDLNEIHIVGGLWRGCDLDYYQELFTRIRQIDEKIHIKALTAVEYDFLARHHNIPLEEVYKKMMGWGLNSLPGGGAEVLVDSIRNKLAPGKMDSESFLNAHRVAHKLGLKSNISLLFGSIESWEDIISHLEKVRSFQDETGGFNTFVPLKYHEENNALGTRKQRLKPKDPRPLFALARLFLDNIPGIKILWNYLGVEMALELLDWGGDDFSSTQLDEKIITLAGGVQIKMDGPTLEKLILSKGRNPKKTASWSR